MKEIIKQYLKDDPEYCEFCFSLCCEVCGSKWSSPPVRFSKSDQQPATESKSIIYETIYKMEYDQARRQAIDYAAQHFNVCPICKRLVCDDCFLICDDLDMCLDCAEHLHEVGEPVSFVGWKV